MKKYTKIQEGNGLETKVYESMRAYFEDDVDLDIMFIEENDYKNVSYISRIHSLDSRNNFSEQATNGLATSIYFMRNTPHALRNVAALTNALIEHNSDEHSNEEFIKPLVNAMKSILNDKKIPDEKKDFLKNAVAEFEILKQTLQDTSPNKRKRKESSSDASSELGPQKRRRTLGELRSGFFGKAAKNIREAFTRPRSNSAPAKLETRTSGLNDTLDSKTDSAATDVQTEVRAYKADKPKIAYEVREMLWQVKAIQDDEAINANFDTIKDSYLDYSQLIDQERQKMKDSGMKESKIDRALLNIIAEGVIRPQNGQNNYSYDELVRFCHFGLKNVAADNSEHAVANADILVQAINQAKNSPSLDSQSQELLQEALVNYPYVNQRYNELKASNSTKPQAVAAKEFLKTTARSHRSNTQNMIREMASSPNPTVDAWVEAMEDVQQTADFKSTLQHYQKTHSASDAHRLANLTGLRQECEKIRRSYHKALAFTPASRLSGELKNIANSAKKITQLAERDLKGKISGLDEVLENEIRDISNIPKKTEKYSSETPPTALRRSRHATVYSALKLKKHGKDSTESLREISKPIRKRAASWHATVRKSEEKREPDAADNTPSKKI